MVNVPPAWPSRQDPSAPRQRPHTPHAERRGPG